MSIASNISLIKKHFVEEISHRSEKEVEFFSGDYRDYDMPNLCLEDRVTPVRTVSLPVRIKCHEPIDPIRHIVIYVGHRNHHLFGPYAQSIEKRKLMFEQLNELRNLRGLPQWKIWSADGDQLVEVLRRFNASVSNTLLVIPAGESSNLDKVFTLPQLKAIRTFFEQGGKGYLTCGAAYWVSKKRVWSSPCESNPGRFEKIEKASRIPLFEGESIGPLCPHPSLQYKAGFYTTAITVTSGDKECTVYVGGGGSFILPDLEPLKLLSSWKEISPSPTILGRGSIYHAKRKIPKASSCPDLASFSKVKLENESNVLVKASVSKKDLSTSKNFLENKPHTQKVTVLVRYRLEELRKIGLSAEEARARQIAAIAVPVGRGQIVLAMFHPYYNSTDFDPEALDRAFPNSGTNWKQVRDRLSPLQIRLDFFHSTVIKPLETPSLREKNTI